MKLALVKSEDLGDWYCIEKAAGEHDGVEEFRPTGRPNSMSFFRSARVSDACVEGPSYEMRAIAEAIEKRGRVSHKRCAVDATDNPVLFWSPRNSQEAGRVSLADADDLAKQIRGILPEEPLPLPGKEQT